MSKYTQVPNTHKTLRIKIMHNIGILFVKMGQYSDACSSFEWIMSEQGDFKTGLHLVLCYYATGDKDRMKKGFSQLVEIPLEVNLGENFDAMTQWKESETLCRAASVTI